VVANQVDDKLTGISLFRRTDVVVDNVPPNKIKKRIPFPLVNVGGGEPEAVVWVQSHRVGPRLLQFVRSMSRSKNDPTRPLTRSKDPGYHPEINE